MNTPTGNQSKYAKKKASQKAGTYHGNSPFFSNLRDFQFLKPLHLDSYPHLKAFSGARLPGSPRQRAVNQESENEVN